MQITEIITDETLREIREHGTPEFPFEYYLDDIDEIGQGYVEWHWHNEIEWAWVESGKVICRIGNEKIILEAGEGIFINSRVIHRFETPGGALMPNILHAPELLAARESAIYQKYVSPVITYGKEYVILEKEKNIQRDLHDGIVPYGGNLTVLDLVQKYIGQKKGVRHNTQANYDFVINIIKKEEFGTRRIDKIKLSDAKAWFIKLQADGRGYSSIHSVRGIVRPAFQMAVEDDLLRKNPFEFQLCTVVVNDSVTRQAITKEQEELFLEFIRNDDHYSKYYNGMFILFKTGLRISEFCGLTVKDIDLQERKINVNHQLQRTRGMQYVIEDTKTSSGTRMLPMTDEVYECFEQIVKNRKKVRVEPIIDGYSRFLFLDKKDMPEVALHWEKHFQWALGKYNRTHEEQMPKITPHVCRHTYCSNMAKAGMNPKALQYLMGHSDIGVTLNVYTHLGLIDAKEEMNRIAKLA